MGQEIIIRPTIKLERNTRTIPKLLQRLNSIYKKKTEYLPNHKTIPNFYLQIIQAWIRLPTAKRGTNKCIDVRNKYYGKTGISNIIKGVLDDLIDKSHNIDTNYVKNKINNNPNVIFNIINY